MSISRTVTTAVIPAAGLGTRLMPATKAVPKELISILDKPSIMYVLEEALDAGIKKIVLVSGPGKNPIEDFFDIGSQTMNRLKQENKQPLVDSFLQFRNKFELEIVYQEKPLGLGHAVLMAEEAVGQSPFLVMLPDELNVAIPGNLSPSQQLCQNFNSSGVPCVWVSTVLLEQVALYGIVDLGGKENLESNVLKTKGIEIKSLVEKPDSKTTPSTLALPGRYVFTPELFDFLKNVRPGRNGEIQLTDAMNDFCKSNKLNAVQIEAHRYDVGNKLGLAKTIVEFALRDPEIKEQFSTFLKQKL